MYTFPKDKVRWSYQVSKTGSVSIYCATNGARPEYEGRAQNEKRAREIVYENNRDQVESNHVD